MTEADKQVFTSIRFGDIEAFEAIFKEYYPELCRTAARCLVDTDDAEEVVQDFFIKLWEKRDTLAIHTSLPAYLHRAVSNHAINYWKSRKNIPKHTDYSSAEVANLKTLPLDESVLNDDLEKIVTALMKKLPEKSRVILHMSRFEEMKNQEIADELGISIKTVEYRLSTALNFLKNKLQDYLPIILFIALIQLI
jgi:RNA polymerase sigma-70 factor (ECF subfamily)